MKEGLLEKIKSVGFWRVNVRPINVPVEKLTLADCSRVVAESSVRLRGWDYPHISQRQDEHGGYANAGDYVENWCDWAHHVEFWRMYKSSQFLHYKALWEDLSNGGIPRAQVRQISVGGTIYLLTEIMEFTFRLSRAALYSDGADLSITLDGSEGRALWVDDPMRVDFIETMGTLAPAVTISRRLSKADLGGAPSDPAISVMKEFFDHFGWTPREEQLRADQAQLYRRA